MKTSLKTYSVQEFKKYKSEHDIEYCVYKTLYGITLVAVIDNYVCSVFFGSNQKEVLYEMKTIWNKHRFTKKSSQLHEDIFSIITATNNNSNKIIPLLLCGTPFQLKVWEALLTIPKGKTTTYAEIAKKIKAPKAVRAVGTAIGKNKIGFLVPCHRVLRGDGSVGGYRWGTKIKNNMLQTEIGCSY